MKLSQLKAVFAAAALVFAGGFAQAAPITVLDKTVNDGVFTLTAAQAAFLGDASATRIGFLRIQEGVIGDTFNQATILDSTNDDSKILKILNGENTGLIYTGGAFEELGETTINNNGANFFRGVAFLFSTTSNIVFTEARGGTETFNAAQTRGAFGLDVPPVPLPAAGWMLIAGVGGLVAASRRKRKAA